MKIPEATEVSNGDKALMKSEKTHTQDVSAGMCAAWMQGGRWCLPSGRLLGEFALQAGFLAPRLWQDSQRVGTAAKRIGRGGERIRTRAVEV